MDHNERIYIRTLLLFNLLTTINKLYFYLTYFFLLKIIIISIYSTSFELVQYLLVHCSSFLSLPSSF